MKKKILKITKLVALTGFLTFGVISMTGCNDNGTHETTKILDKITIDTSNVKKTYKAGETFDSTGLVVTVFYDDESSKVTTDYTTNLDGKKLTANDEKCIVSYEEGEVKKTKSFNITVQGPHIVKAGENVTINGKTSVELEEGERFPAGTTFEDNSGLSDLIGWKIGEVFGKTVEELIEKFVMPSNDVVVTAIHSSELDKYGEDLGFEKWIPSNIDKASTLNRKNSKGEDWSLVSGLSVGEQVLKTPAEGEEVDKSNPWDYEGTTYTTNAAVTDKNFIYVETVGGINNPHISKEGVWYYTKFTNHNNYDINITLGCEYFGFEIAAENIEIKANSSTTVYCCNKITIKQSARDGTSMFFIKFNGSYDAGLKLSVVGWQLGRE